MKPILSSTLALTLAALFPWPNAAEAGMLSRKKTISLEAVSTFATGVFDGGAAEIVAHDPRSQRLFIVNAEASGIDVLDISDISEPEFLFTIDVTPYGDQANSVAVRDGLVAAAVQANVKTDPGQVVFFGVDGAFIKSLTVGALPDMLAFTPDGKHLLVANEGEPNDDYTVDPLGTVSIIRVKNAANLVQEDVVTLDFSAFNDAALDPDIRIFGPGATVAQDIEPEYIAISEDSQTAFVTLQENNALAVIDINRKRIVRLEGLGFKNHSQAGNALDASDRDNAINIANWPVFGMYQPDAIASFRVRGRNYTVLANEGDARDYATFGEEARVKDLVLDPAMFPNAAELASDAQIGRLTVTTTLGDLDDDGDYDRLFSFGARSISIRNQQGELVWDSGSLLEEIVAENFPADFNSNHEENGSFDNRSDNKGPEPEGLVLGKIRGKTYVFAGLERMSGIAVFNVSNPDSPEFVEYVSTRDFAGDAEAGTAGDLGPEGLAFIEAKDSPSGKPLLVVANEISGTTTIYEISVVNENVR